MNTEEIIEKITDLVITYGPKLIGGILILIIGSWIVKLFSKNFGKFLDKKNIDASLKPFLKSMFNVILRALLFISVLTFIGIPITSFVAILGAAGLAVGLALSGTLQNFAGGVMILMVNQ